MYCIVLLVNIERLFHFLLALHASCQLMDTKPHSCAKSKHRIQFATQPQNQGTDQPSLVSTFLRQGELGLGLI